ncbi:MAG: PspC domain-containing protein [Burkholderiales bacterium]|nr:MAG: PspC domain-containing protein [Burkholderiales bacterium]
MGWVDQLERLSELHSRGAITDAEYERAKARVLNEEQGAQRVPREPRTSLGMLRRAQYDRWIGGVCGGIAAATGTESWVWRLLFTAGLVFGGATAVIYVLLWIFVPPAEPEVPPA